MRKRYNTPHRSRVVKTRMTEEEYADFTERLKHYDMSQAEFIRQAITGAAMVFFPAASESREYHLRPYHIQRPLLGLYP